MGFRSPRYHSSSMPAGPIEKWDTDEIIYLFQDRTDGWQLEIADRCINGWKNEMEEQCIQTKHLDGRPANHIPDSGWAVMSIVLSYFETIAFFKSDLQKKKSYELFKWGVFDVFPEHKNRTPNIATHLYSDLRNNLYHVRSGKSKTVLIHTITSEAIEPDSKTGIVYVDPHKFVRRLRSHLEEYCEALLSPHNREMRQKFRKAFLGKYA